MSNMAFLNPLLVFGALLGIVPVIIHLIHRRRARPRPFAAIAFVLASTRRVARAYKLKQLLLLLARVLLLALIPLTAARLALLPEAMTGRDAGTAPSSVAIVVDNSYSMGQDTGEQTLFALAKAEAKSRIQSLKPGDDAFVIPTTLNPGEAGLAPALTYDRAALLKAVDDLALSQSFGAMDNVLSRVAQGLERGQKPRHVVCIVSDFAANGYNLSARPFGDSAVTPQVELLDVRQDDGYENLQISQVDTLRDYAAGPGRYRVNVTARNLGRRPISQAKLMLKLDGLTVATGFFSAPGRGEEVKQFTLKVDEPGNHVLEATLEKDALERDNHRFALLSVPPRISVLMVNGDPSTIFYRDEVFYLRNALNPQGLGFSGITVEETTAAGLLKPRFDAFDVVMLCNVGALPEAAINPLKHYVQAGGGLFISAGNRLMPDFYNERLGELLPGVLRSPTAVGGAEAGGAANVTVSLDLPDPGHALLAIYDPQTVKSLKGSRFTTFQPFDPNPRKVKDLVLRYSNGQPALVQYRVGQGSVLFLTSTVDRDWGDFCIRTSFLPLMQESVKMLSRSRTDRAPREQVVAVGQTWASPVQSPRIDIEGPEGFSATLAMKSAGGDAAPFPVDLPPLPRAGQYLLRFEDPGPRFPLLVNVDPAEGDLKPLDREDLAAYFSREGKSQAFFSGREGSLQEYALWFAWVVLALFLAEHLLIRSLMRPARQARDMRAGLDT